MSRQQGKPSFDRKKLEEIAKQNNFSPKEVEDFLGFSNTMAGLPVKEYLTYYVKSKAAEFGYTDPIHPKYNIYKKVLAKLMKLETKNFVGKMQMEFTDINKINYVLSMYATVVDSNYEIRLEIPPMENQNKLRGEILQQMDRLVDLVQQYYQTIISENKLGADIAELFSEIDCSILQINPINRELFITHDCNKSIGIVIIYVNNTAPTA